MTKEKNFQCEQPETEWNNSISLHNFIPDDKKELDKAKSYQILAENPEFQMLMYIHP